MGAWNIKCINDEEELNNQHFENMMIKLTSVVMLTIK